MPECLECTGCGACATGIRPDRVSSSMTEASNLAMARAERSSVGSARQVLRVVLEFSDGEEDCSDALNLEKRIHRAVFCSKYCAHQNRPQ